jgi:hypothetical protein
MILRGPLSSAIAVGTTACDCSHLAVVLRLLTSATVRATSGGTQVVATSPGSSQRLEDQGQSPLSERSTTGFLNL